MLKKFNRFISLMLLLSFVFLLQVPAIAAPTINRNNLVPAGLDPNFDSGIKMGTSQAVEGVYLMTGLAASAYEYDTTNHCLKITAPTNAWTNLTLRGFSFKAGKTYVISYDAKLGGETSNSVTFGVDLQGTKTLTPCYKPTKTVTNAEWTRIYSIFSCETSNNTTYIAFRFLTNTETVLIDNLAIYEINYDTNNLLNSNYSFENAVPSGKFEVSGTPELYNDGSDGNYSLKIPTGAVTDGNLAKLCRFTNLSVTGGAMYELSADVKLTNAVDGVSAYITAQRAGNATQATGEAVIGDRADRVSVSSNNWTKVKRIYPANVLGDATLNVGIGLLGLPDSGCDVLVDNFVVKKIADPVSVVGIGTSTGSVTEYENKIAVNVTPAEAKSVWMLIAKYNGSALVDVALKEAEVTTAGQTIGYTFSNVVQKENSVVYIWEEGTFDPILQKIDFRAVD